MCFELHRRDGRVVIASGSYAGSREFKSRDDQISRSIFQPVRHRFIIGARSCVEGAISRRCAPLTLYTLRCSVASRIKACVCFEPATASITDGTQKKIIGSKWNLMKSTT